MAAKGTEAKAELLKKFMVGAGADYLGEKDKKWYFKAKEKGEDIQIAITMTCPNTPYAAMPCSEADLTSSCEATSEQAATAVSAEDRAEIERLASVLGITL